MAALPETQILETVRYAALDREQRLEYLGPQSFW